MTLFPLGYFRISFRLSFSSESWQEQAFTRNSPIQKKMWGYQVEEEYSHPSCEVILSELKHVSDDLRDTKDELKVLHERIDKVRDAAVFIYVTKDQFAPVRNVVYGLVGIIMTTVIGAILMIVLKAKG